MSLFDFGVLASIALNAVFCGFGMHLLWRRDKAERLARESSQNELKKSLGSSLQSAVDNQKLLIETLTESVGNLFANHSTLIRNHLKEVQDHNCKVHNELISLSNRNHVAIAETLRPVIDWCYVTQHQVMELRGKFSKNPAGDLAPATPCGHCNETVKQWFIDGYGRITCEKCKPEGFKDAVNRGIAKL